MNITASIKSNYHTRKGVSQRCYRLMHVPSALVSIYIYRSTLSLLRDYDNILSLIFMFILLWPRIYSHSKCYTKYDKVTIKYFSCHLFPVCHDGWKQSREFAIYSLFCLCIIYIYIYTKNKNDSFKCISTVFFLLIGGKTK